MRCEECYNSLHRSAPSAERRSAFVEQIFAAPKASVSIRLAMASLLGLNARLLRCLKMRMNFRASASHFLKLVSFFRLSHTKMKLTDGLDQLIRIPE